MGKNARASHGTERLAKPPSLKWGTGNAAAPGISGQELIDFFPFLRPNAFSERDSARLAVVRGHQGGLASAGVEVGERWQAQVLPLETTTRGSYSAYQNPSH